MKILISRSESSRRTLSGFSMTSTSFLLFAPLELDRWPSLSSFLVLSALKPLVVDLVSEEDDDLMGVVADLIPEVDDLMGVVLLVVRERAEEERGDENVGAGLDWVGWERIGDWVKKVS